MSTQNQGIRSSQGFYKCCFRIQCAIGRQFLTFQKPTAICEVCTFAGEEIGSGRKSGIHKSKGCTFKGLDEVIHPGNESSVKFFAPRVMLHFRRKNRSLKGLFVMDDFYDGDFPGVEEAFGLVFGLAV